MLADDDHSRVSSAGAKNVRRAGAWGVYGGFMGGLWGIHGVSMGGPWGVHGGSMGGSMGGPWGVYGRASRAGYDRAGQSKDTAWQDIAKHNTAAHGIAEQPLALSSRGKGRGAYSNLFIGLNGLSG